MTPINSFPKTRDIRIGRIKRDECEIVIVIAFDGVPADLTDTDVEIIFTSGSRVVLVKPPDDVDGNKVLFVINNDDKRALGSSYFGVSIRVDKVTVGEGTFSWQSQCDDKSKNPPAIGININTIEETIEWFEVVIGPRGPQGIQGIQGVQGIQGPQGLQGVTGKSAYQYAVEKGYPGTEEEFAEEMAHLPEYAGEAEGYKNEAKSYRDNAQEAAQEAENSAISADQSADDAGDAAGTAITARNQAETFAGNAGSSATAAGNSAIAAGNSESNANISAQNAADSADEANQSKIDAEEAKDAAELSAENAANAEQGAIDAKDEVDAIKDSFIRNNSDTFGAKVTAIVSLTQTEFDALPLKLNTTMYIVSPDPASVILQLVGLTQAEYDGLPVKDNQTAYLIEYAA